MSNNRKTIRLIGLDIPDGYLQYLEDLLYSRGIFREKDVVYIKGHSESIELDLESTEYAKFIMEHRDSLVVGRPSIPAKIFNMFNVVFDFYQYKKSTYGLFLLKDPSLIDDTEILDQNLVPDDLLLSVINTIDIPIDPAIIELSILHGYSTLRLSNKIPIEILDIIELLDKISNEMLDLIEEHSSAIDLSDGKYYKLKLHRDMVIAEEKIDIRVTRYNNIIKKTKEKISRAKNDTGDLTEEHLDMLMALKNEDNKSKNITLKRLVYTIEKLEEPVEVEYRAINRGIQSLNIELKDED